MRPRWFSFAARVTQVQGQSRIVPIQFRRLDQPLRTIHGIRFEPHDLIGGFEQIEIPMHCHRRQLDIPPQLTLIEKVTDPQRRRLHEPLKVPEIGHGRQVTQIAL
jgi:hypothetical protein